MTLNGIWKEYVRRLNLINNTASKKALAYLNKYGIPESYEDREKLIKYANGLVMKYGEASSAMACEMYDAISVVEKVKVPPAVPAALPTYSEVAIAINGTIKDLNEEIITGAVERLVKMPGADTMLNNAIRDRAEYAWIPSGDTCAFCIALAANGWQTATPSIMSGDHADHIHANCHCTFAIRHSSDTEIKGYEPEEYREMYDDADTSSYGFDSDRPKGQQWQSMSKAKINGLRREFYAENKEEINEQKRSAYEKRKERESDKAEEIEVN